MINYTIITKRQRERDIMWEILLRVIQGVGTKSTEENSSTKFTLNLLKSPNLTTLLQIYYSGKQRVVSAWVGVW